MSKEKKGTDRFAAFDEWECDEIAAALFLRAKRDYLPDLSSINDDDFENFMQVIRLAQEALGKSRDEES
jgi:hypothetical protein